MKLVKVHSCNNCRACEYNPITIEYECSLGFKMKNNKPLEPCIKPLTIKQFVKYLNDSTFFFH